MAIAAPGKVTEDDDCRFSHREGATEIDPATSSLHTGLRKGNSANRQSHQIKAKTLPFTKKKSRKKRADCGGAWHRCGECASDVTAAHAPWLILDCRCDSTDSLLVQFSVQRPCRGPGWFYLCSLGLILVVSTHAAFPRDDWGELLVRVFLFVIL